MKKEERIKVLHLPPKGHPKPHELINTLDGLQEAVGGLIEFIPLDGNYSLLLNEEGKLIGLEPNRRLGSDVLVGDVYVVKENDDGELISMEEWELKMFCSLFYEWDDDIDKEEIEASCGFSVCFF